MNNSSRDPLARRCGRRLGNGPVFRALLIWIIADATTWVFFLGSAFANEIMTDHCSADVSFPSTYDGPPVGLGSFIVSRGGHANSANWTFPIRQTLDSDGHIRWWCHSTTGNRADPGTYTFDKVGATYVCGNSNGSDDCILRPDIAGPPSTDLSGWTAKSSRCDNRSNVFRARLGPNRSLEIECLYESTGTIEHRLVANSPSAPGTSVPAVDVRYAAIWRKEPEGEWVARHDLTSEGYRQEFNQQISKGLRLVLVDGFEADGRARYAAIWSRQASPPWVAHHGMTAADYQMAFNKYVADGYRLVWVSGYTVNGSGRYTAIWEKSPGPEWIARYGLSAADYQRDFDSLVKHGYRLKLVSGYAVEGNARYAALWEKDSENSWVARHGMTSQAYQREFDQQVAEGYRLAHISGYRVGDQILFAAIWDKQPAQPWIARHNMTADQYQQEFNNMIANGYRLVEVGGY